MQFDLNKGVYTLKELIPKEIWDLEWQEFSKSIKKHKKLFQREKIFILLFKKFKPTWDIALDGIWAVDALKLNKKHIFGLIKAINPQFGDLIKADDIYEHIKRDRLKFNPVEIDDIIEILTR